MIFADYLINDLGRKALEYQRREYPKRRFCRMLKIRPKIFYQIEPDDLRNEVDRWHYIEFGRLPWDHPIDLSFSRNKLLMVLAYKQETEPKQLELFPKERGEF